MTKLIGCAGDASTLQPFFLIHFTYSHVPDMRCVRRNNRHGSGWTATISRFVHSIYKCMATTGRLPVANCFVLFGPKTMVVRLLCVYKGLKSKVSDLYPCNNRVHPQFRSCIFRGQVPRSPSFLTLLSQFTWLVLPRDLIPFLIVLSRCSPSHSLLPYFSLLRYPPLMLMLD